MLSKLQNCMNKKQVAKAKIMKLFSSTENILQEEHKVFVQAHPFIETFIKTYKHVKINSFK